MKRKSWWTPHPQSRVLHSKACHATPVEHQGHSKHPPRLQEVHRTELCDGTRLNGEHCWTRVTPEKTYMFDEPSHTSLRYASTTEDLYSISRRLLRAGCRIALQESNLTRTPVIWANEDSLTSGILTHPASLLACCLYDYEKQRWEYDPWINPMRLTILHIW